MNMSAITQHEHASSTVPTVFVVGNGPSLKDFDFTQLEKYDWVGMNAAHRYWARSGIYPTFYACLDLILGVSHIDAIVDMVARADTLIIKSFLLRDDLISRSEVLQQSPLVINFDYHFKDRPDRILDLVTTGSHAALWMNEMGYAQIVLLGIDVNYVEQVPGAKRADDDESPHKLTIVREAENANYFIQDYQKVDDSYTVPNPEPDVHIAAWRRVNSYIDRASKSTKLYNGSAISKLDCIDFINASDFLLIGHSNIETVSQKLESRAAEGETDQNPICTVNGTFAPGYLSYFLHALLPVHYGEILCHDLQSHQLFPGWVRSSLASDSFTKWSGLCLSIEAYLQQPDYYTHCGFIVLVTGNSSLVEEAVKTLFLDLDAVYGIKELGDKVQISQYPNTQAGVPNYIIAFTRRRFWRPEIKAALEAALQPDSAVAKKAFDQGLRKRRLRFRMKTLKTKFGL